MSKKKNDDTIIVSTCLYGFTIVVLFFVVAWYFFSSFNFNLDAPLKNWVDTASYFNGILTPPLLAITSIFIFLTWQTSKKELKATNDVLEFDKAIKIFNAMLDSSTKAFERKISSKQKNQAYNKLLNDSAKNEKMPLYKILEDERTNRKLSKYRFFCVLKDFTHEECFTKFGEPEYAPSTNIHNLEDTALVLALFKHELMNQYYMDLPKEELAKPIRRFFDILDFIARYNDNLEVRNALIDLFLFNIDEMTLTLLSEGPLNEHEIFNLILEN